MAQTHLVSYPRVVYTMPSGMEAHRRVAIAVSLVEGDQESTDENVVFAVAEAVCADGDVFDRAKGRQTAIHRLDSTRQSHSFSLADAKNVNGEGDDRVSSVLSPITRTPLPHGILNRLRMLIPR